ncbi:MAG: class I SAM-dependent methyltransferase [Candidatus Nanopelagicales bacterium]|nr:class I SAM-dependent methyltransferase [Candidatus Nanopelagicales bacterium]
MAMTLAQAFELIVPAERGVGFRAYDGSTAGPADAAVTLDIRTPRAVEYLASSPNQLGLARAYVTGDMEIIGSAYDAMTRLYPMPMDHLTAGDKLKLGRLLAGKAFKRPTPPPQERTLKGDRHSKRRDAEAIHHHYDVSNLFYSWVLGPSMAYTCAVFPDADASLEVAQATKFDLVCRKLGLEPGMRLLDIGCGWGGMVRHAVKYYGVTAIGATLSEQQALFAQQRIAEEGLGDRAEVRFSDYRDVRETDFDAISSIGLTEHIGRDNYPAYFAFAYGKLKTGGRMLNHTITRSDDGERAIYKNSFINRYVFPDGELSGPGHIMSAFTNAGFEIRHEENLREHYALTLKHWCDNLEEHWDEAVAEAGLGTARVWRLYMAASRMGFDINNIQLHQMLAVKNDARGRAGMPLRPDFTTHVDAFV